MFTRNMLSNVNSVQILRKDKNNHFQLLTFCILKSKIYSNFSCSLLVTTSADQTACIWKISDFSLKQEFKDEKQRWVWDTAFTNDSEHLLTGTILSSLL